MKKDIPMSSYKGNIGHLLRCSGFVSIAFAIISIKENIIPSNINIFNHLEIEEYNIPRKIQKKEINSVLVNSWGFCGNYSSIIVGE